MNILKRAGQVALALLGLLVVLFLGWKWYLDATYFNGYDPAAPLNTRLIKTEEKEAYLRVRFDFAGNRGEMVPAVIATPHNAPPKMPCVIFLHGIGQDMRFIDEICTPFTKEGFAFVTFDQYTRGERKQKDLSKLQAANAFRMRAAYTVNDTRRLVDYLLSRTDIDPARIYLAGASYGAITGATAAAFDKRIAAVSLIYGGGGIRALTRSREITKELGAKRPLVELLGWAFLGIADPARYVAGIAPRPVFIQNGEDDGMIADEAARILQAAAKDPKEIKWYKGDHIGLDEATLWKVLDDDIAFFKRQQAGS